MNSWLSMGINALQQSPYALLLLSAWLKSLLILAAMGGVGLCWRQASASARHWLWFLATATLLVMPWGAFTVPMSPGPTWLLSADLESGNQVDLVLQFGPSLESGSRPSPAGSPVAGANTTEEVGTGPTPMVSARFHQRWLAIVPVVWFLGTAVVFVFFSLSGFHLRRLRRRARVLGNTEWVTLVQELSRTVNLRRNARLMQSADPVIPMTWGWVQPTILLPAQADQWSEERRRIVLWHELCHIKRWDGLAQRLAQMVCALFWCNPLVWVAARRMRVERERACDDMLINGGCQASAYASHLVEIAGSYRFLPRTAAMAMARESGLKRRVTAILDAHRNRSRLAKRTAGLLALGMIGWGWFISGCATTMTTGPVSGSDLPAGVRAQLRQFVVDKEAQAVAGAKSQGKELLPEFKSLFAAAARGDWQTIKNLWEDLRAHGSDPSDPGYSRQVEVVWQTALETWGAFESMVSGGDRLVAMGRDIVASLPPGSIYFGGTDPGRFTITALQKSHVQADPFFTLTQNALADVSYLQYLRGMYGPKIHLPTPEDSQRCFTEYMADVQQRLKEDRLKPGEEVKHINGRLQVSGQVAVMMINASLAKIIFARNPTREFYLEESFPLEWMYPHLSPHGPILKIHRQPWMALTEEMIRRDREYWTRTVKPLIGDWLDYDMPLPKIIALVEKAYGQSSPLSADPAAEPVRKWGSKLRGAIGGIYAWRYEHASDPMTKRQMLPEADFAYRQAFAMCPQSPDVVLPYVKLLIGQARLPEAASVATTASRLAPENPGFRDLARKIENLARDREKKTSSP